MTIDELLSCFKRRVLNTKTNNMIIIVNDIEELVDNIPNITSLDNYNGIDNALNIKIDLSKINLNSILTYSLNYLKDKNLIDDSLEYRLPFNNKFDINKFRIILQNNNIMVQLFFYNIERLSIEEQKLFNELYYYNSYDNNCFNIITLAKKDFKTYSLNQDRMLDDRENYQKYRIIKSKMLIKGVGSHERK